MSPRRPPWTLCQSLFFPWEENNRQVWFALYRQNKTRLWSWMAVFQYGRTYRKPARHFENALNLTFFILSVKGDLCRVLVSKLHNQQNDPNTVTCCFLFLHELICFYLKTFFVWNYRLESLGTLQFVCFSFCLFVCLFLPLKRQLIICSKGESIW